MNKALAYKVTKTTVPRWSDSLHAGYPRGYAYEDDTHFVHYYGIGSAFCDIAIGLTAIEKKSGTLEDWVKRVFGAEDIVEIETEVGTVVKGVWRPSLYFPEDTYLALSVSEQEMRLSENALRLLINKLDDIFLYIEPSSAAMNVYSHKTRELLILACTELENFWKYYADKSAKLRGKKRLTTNDYAKLCKPLHLKEYQFTLNTYASVPPISPFEHWDPAKPTASLTWYDAYNKTKHDRDKHFEEATLIHCINAVVACLVMHCVKFSPYQMFGQNNTFSALINQHFSGSLVNPDYKSFCLFRLNLKGDVREDLFIFDVKDYNYRHTLKQIDFDT